MLPNLFMRALTKCTTVHLACPVTAKHLISPMGLEEMMILTLDPKP